MGRSIVTKSMPAKVRFIHKASGCRVDGESVNELVNVLNIQSRDGISGWSMIEIALVSRCIIGA